MYALEHEPERARRPRFLLGAGVVAAALQTGALALAARIEPPVAQAPRAVETVSLTFVAPPPPPPPAPEPAPAPAPEPAPEPAPKPTPKPRPKPKPKPRPKPRPTPKAPPPAEAQAPEPAPAAPPKPRLIAGLTLASTVEGSGPRFGVGDTTMGAPGRVASAPGGGRRGPARAGRSDGSPDGVGAGEPARVAAKLKKKTVPDYPAAARKEGIEGTVVLSIVVDTEGRVVRATVVKGLGHGLDQAAVEAAKATLWHPATVGGRPTQSTRRFHVRFTLEV